MELSRDGRMAPTTQNRRGSDADLPALFTAAFTQSRNPMVLVDSRRRYVDANGAYLRLVGYRRDQLIGGPIYSHIVDGPRASSAEWDAALAKGRFTGETQLRHGDGHTVDVQYAATSETVTGRHLVLFVVMTTSRWGGRFRRTAADVSHRTPLSSREREIVRLVAFGGTGPEIAEELGIAHDTVRTHVRNAMEKLNARSRAHLVAKAIGEGVIFRESPSGDPT